MGSKSKKGKGATSKSTENLIITSFQNGLSEGCRMTFQAFVTYVGIVLSNEVEDLEKSNLILAEWAKLGVESFDFKPTEKEQLYNLTMGFFDTLRAGVVEEPTLEK